MTSFQWWCASNGLPWSWQWKAYPGVWLIVATVGVFMLLLLQRRAKQDRISARVRIPVIAGVLLLWVALDWPLGALGSGYLASAHAVQFILLAMIVPPLLLQALPPSVADRSDPGTPSLIGTALHPLVQVVGFNATMAVTHHPVVTDSLMVSQWGTFTLDMAWLISGLAFWTPVIRSRHASPTFSPFLQMLYLFAGTQGHLLLAMWLIDADFPRYAIYELAPRALPMSAMSDQAVAGGILLLAGGSFMLVAISVVFFTRIAPSHARETG